MRAMTIGEVSQAAGTVPDTVRFYERSGLLPRPPRSRSGYRQYSPDALRRLCFIRQAKALGFSLDEIRELMALRVTPGKRCADVKVRAALKLQEVEQRIEALSRMRDTLQRLVAACGEQVSIDACPIVSALEIEGQQR